MEEALNRHVVDQGKSGLNSLLEREGAQRIHDVFRDAENLTEAAEKSVKGFLVFHDESGPAELKSYSCS